MTRLTKRTAGGLWLALFFALFVQPGLSHTAATPPQAIKVYFYHDPGEYIDLSPVTRMVRTRTPARAAINALLAGPTRREEKMGFVPLASARDFTIGSLTIKEGTAASISWRAKTGTVGLEISPR